MFGACMPMHMDVRIVYTRAVPLLYLRPPPLTCNHFYLPARSFARVINQLATVRVAHPPTSKAVTLSTLTPPVTFSPLRSKNVSDLARKR